jgi:hypothetical protein
VDNKIRSEIWDLHYSGSEYSKVEVCFENGIEPFGFLKVAGFGDPQSVVVSPSAFCRRH